MQSLPLQASTLPFKSEVNWKTKRKPKNKVNNEYVWLRSLVSLVLRFGEDELEHERICFLQIQQSGGSARAHFTKLFNDVTTADVCFQVSWRSKHENGPNGVRFRPRLRRRQHRCVLPTVRPPGCTPSKHKDNSRRRLPWPENGGHFVSLEGSQKWNGYRAEGQNKLHNRRIAGHRWRIEAINSRLKTFGVLRQRFRHQLKLHMVMFSRSLLCIILMSFTIKLTKFAGESVAPFMFSFCSALLLFLPALSRSSFYLWKLIPLITPNSPNYTRYSHCCLQPQAFAEIVTVAFSHKPSPR